jgi:hypothetical protein
MRIKKICNGGFLMKRTILFFMLASCVIALVSAHDFNPREQRRFYGEQPNQQRGRENFRSNRPSAENASVSGNLAIVQGRIAVTSGDVTYIAGGIQRFVGFIDGLKEGATVTLEGNAYSVPHNESVKFLHVQKMTFNGKDYDLARPRPDIASNPAPHQIRPMQDRMPQSPRMPHPQYYNVPRGRR